MQIRPYRERDRDAVVGLWDACDLLRPWNDPHADIALCVRTATSALFVGTEAHDRVVGVVMSGADGHRGWLYYLAVDPARRRARIGEALVHHAESWLATLGITKVQLMIRAENTAVGEFYARLGYEQEERVIMSRRP